MQLLSIARSIFCLICAVIDDWACLMVVLRALGVVTNEDRAGRSDWYYRHFVTRKAAFHALPLDAKSFLSTALRSVCAGFGLLANAI